MLQTDTVMKTTSRSWIALACVWVVLSASILFRTWANPAGYLSGDSGYYLRVAQNILDGRGPMVHAYGPYPERLTVWPPGYPVLIAVAAKATGLPVLWASKVVGMLSLAACIALAALLLGDAWVVGIAVFFHFALMEVFTTSWSEAPFLALLLGIVFVLQRQMGPSTASRQPSRELSRPSTKSVDDAWARDDPTVAESAGERARTGRHVLLALLCVCASLVRYIGASLFVLPGLLALHHLVRRRWKQAASVAIATVPAAVFVGWMIWTNGRAGGAALDARPVASDTPLGFVRMLALGVANAFFYFHGRFTSLGAAAAAGLAQIALLAGMWRSAGNGLAQDRGQPTEVADRGTGLRPSDGRWTAALLALAGTVLTGATIASRTRFAFDPIGYRLMVPAVLCFGLALCSVAWSRIGAGARRRLALMLAGFAAASFVFNAGVRPLNSLLRRHDPRLAARQQQALEAAARCPDFSIVVTRDPITAMHLLYARPRIRPEVWDESAKAWPAFTNEIASRFRGAAVCVLEDTKTTAPGQSAFAQDDDTREVLRAAPAGAGVISRR